MHLDLLEYAWSQHVFLENYAAATAFAAGLNLAVGRARSGTLFANQLFLYGELHVSSQVEVSEWYKKSNFQIRSSPLSAATSVR